MSKTKLIFLEGNIGSGKSTALNFLEKNFPATFLKEPVDDWQNVGGHNLLDLMYQDTEKYAFSFQTYAFISRMKKLIDCLKKKDKIIVCERSIFTDRYVFFESLYQMGKVTEAEKKIYESLWDFWTEMLKPFLDNVELSFLYIRCEPEICMEHIIIRSRNEETGIKLDYLDILHKNHEAIYGSISQLEKIMSNEVDIKIVDNEGDKEFFNRLKELL